mmetsp:Transcript_108198/g.203115  ORF Transcript_108198/g.203115 Transcript_108198/m.203115 type:complete len:208 (+) Transcript_108198:1553-2176(+)
MSTSNLSVKHVCWLQVTVHNPVMVQIAHSLNYLTNSICSFIIFKHPFLYQAINEHATVHTLHHQMQLRVSLVHVLQLHNVWMVYGHVDFQLGQEAHFRLLAKALQIKRFHSKSDVVMAAQCKLNTAIQASAKRSPSQHIVILKPPCSLLMISAPGSNVANLCLQRFQHRLYVLFALFDMLWGTANVEILVTHSKQQNQQVETMLHTN